MTEFKSPPGPGCECCDEEPDCILFEDDFEREELGPSWDIIAASAPLIGGKLHLDGLIKKATEPVTKNVSVQVTALLTDGDVLRLIIGANEDLTDGIYGEICLASGEEASYLELGRIDGSYCKRVTLYYFDGNGVNTLTGDFSFPLELSFHVCLHPDGSASTYFIETDSDEIRPSVVLQSHTPIDIDEKHIAVDTSSTVVLDSFLVARNQFGCSTCSEEALNCQEYECGEWEITQGSGFGNWNLSGLSGSFNSGGEHDGNSITALIYLKTKQTVTMEISGTGLGCDTANAGMAISLVCSTPYSLPAGDIRSAQIDEDASLHVEPDDLEICQDLIDELENEPECPVGLYNSNHSVNGETTTKELDPGLYRISVSITTGSAIEVTEEGEECHITLVVPENASFSFTVTPGGDYEFGTDCIPGLEQGQC